jgi:hypothetical protein
MHKIVLLLGLSAALVLIASAWNTLQPATVAPSAAMDIDALHRGTDTSQLPTAPVEQYAP